MSAQLQLDFSMRPTPPPSAAIPLDPDAQALRSILAGARGPAAAVTIAEICRRLGRSRRDVEALIETALPDLGLPIVAGADGYYVAKDSAQVARYLASLRSRIICISLRMRSVRRSARAAGLSEPFSMSESPAPTQPAPPQPLPSDSTPISPMSESP